MDGWSGWGGGGGVTICKQQRKKLGEAFPRAMYDYASGRYWEKKKTRSSGAELVWKRDRESGRSVEFPLENKRNMR